MIRKITFLFLICAFALSLGFSSDLRGTGYGPSREEARANAVRDIKTQIIVEQESLLEIRTSETNKRSSNSFNLLIREYSRELPLERVEFSDSNDPSQDFGMEWQSIAVVSSSNVGYYQKRLETIFSEITDINGKIVDDNSPIKNISWTKTLLDLCYDYLNYSMIISLLDPSVTVPDIPVSLHRVKLEYEDLVKRQKNELESNISAMTLRLAYGDLLPDDMALLEQFQNEYVSTVKNLDILAGNERKFVDYKTIDYDSMKPVTASEFLSRIEANRKAFAYYRSSPVSMSKKLTTLSSNAIADLDEISKKTFASSSDTDDLSFEIIKYSSVNEGWIGKAVLVLGGETIQFSFLIPFEALAETSFNSFAYERLNNELLSHPDDLLRLNITYTVRGEFIGNSYNLTIRSLEIEKITNRKSGKGKTIYKAANKNPWTTTFEYGTAVDLGDVGEGTKAAELRLKANKETKSGEKILFHSSIDVGAKAGMPFSYQEDETSSESDKTKLLYDGMVSAMAGILFPNNKSGRDLVYYGVDVQASWGFIEGLFVSTKYADDTTESTNTILDNHPSEVVLDFLYQNVYDGTMDNYLNTYGGVGLGFNPSCLIVQVGVGFMHKVNKHVGLSFNIGLRGEFGKENFVIGLNPKFAAEVRF